MFIKKSSVPNPVKSPLLKTLAIPSDTTAERSAVEREDLKSHWKLENVCNSGGDQHTL